MTNKSTLKKNLTPQQEAAVTKSGRLIVSASAGSGKTFVMIERLCRYIESGGDLDNVLAVTFTKKAAAQMKDKLRQSLIEKSGKASGADREHIKRQLDKIGSANISTIHSFCTYLLRVYFYELGIDASFEILSDDEDDEMLLRSRAMDMLFDRLYSEKDKDLEHLLARYTKKRSDDKLKEMIAGAYNDIRNNPDYRSFLENTADIYTEEMFDVICSEILEDMRKKCSALEAYIEDFMSKFDMGERADYYLSLRDKMISCLKSAKARTDLFAPLHEFKAAVNTRGMTDEEKETHEVFVKMRDDVKKKYKDFNFDFSDRQTELFAFLESGKTAAAYSRLIERFDDLYGELKREEGKLDYGDLEHLTLKLFRIKDGNILNEIRGRFTHVFVDEYQDVNPVQERIISLIGGDNLFLVGDVKQAIYGFRGSQSKYFTQKVRELERCGASLELSSNFRSAPAVVDAVNGMFTTLMREDSCGIDYAKSSVMKAEGPYPSGSGEVCAHFIEEDGKSVTQPEGVYSVVKEEHKNKRLTVGGRAVADLVKRELGSVFFDSEIKAERKVEPGDVCILTRKREDSSAKGIYRALISAGLPVSGARGVNVCEYPEVMQMIDILSYIDNGEQDIPMASAMLSPVGDFTENELSEIRIKGAGAVREKRANCSVKDEAKDIFFRECCSAYAEKFSDEPAKKFKKFKERIDKYRKLTRLFGAGTLIDKILQGTALEAVYMQDGGKKLRNIRRLAREAYAGGAELSLAQFLKKLRASGMNLPAAESGGEDSIKIMTMHSSKGLEFPVVILADISRSFSGKETGNPPLDEKYGFAHKYFDTEHRVSVHTVLTKCCKLKKREDEVRDEMNLLYVACTRAKYRLHIISAKQDEFNPHTVIWALDYSHMLDLSHVKKGLLTPSEDRKEEKPNVCELAVADEKALALFRKRFMQRYEREESAKLPAKTSATALLKMQMHTDDYYAGEDPVRIMPEDKPDPDDRERGTAYHRYLEQCDLSVKDIKQIRECIERFVLNGRMTERQAGLVDENVISRVLSMPFFDKIKGCKYLREQEFLCAIAADKFLSSSAKDGVLVQGAIDLLCLKDDGCVIIDYKYSKKHNDRLRNYYRIQLQIYRLAVSKICNIPLEKIETHIVNLHTCTEIDL